MDLSKDENTDGYIVWEIALRSYYSLWIKMWNYIEVLVLELLKLLIMKMWTFYIKKRINTDKKCTEKKNYTDF